MRRCLPEARGEEVVHGNSPLWKTRMAQGELDEKKCAPMGGGLLVKVQDGRTRGGTNGRETRTGSR